MLVALGVSAKPSKRPDGSSYFATRDEAAYPRPLCVQIVRLICVQLQLPPPVLPAQPPAATGTGAARQAKGRRVLPVVPEFQKILNYTLDALPQVDSKRRLLHAVFDAPAGAKLISSTNSGFEVGRNNEVEDSLGNFDSSRLSFRVVLGCYHSPEEFVCEALQAVHPFDRLRVLPDVLKIRIFQALTKGPVWVHETRVVWPF